MLDVLFTRLPLSDDFTTTIHRELCQNPIWFGWSKAIRLIRGISRQRWEILRRVEGPWTVSGGVQRGTKLLFISHLFDFFIPPACRSTWLESSALGTERLSVPLTSTGYRHRRCGMGTREGGGGMYVCVCVEGRGKLPTQGLGVSGSKGSFFPGHTEDMRICHSKGGTAGQRALTQSTNTLPLELTEACTSFPACPSSLLNNYSHWSWGCVEYVSCLSDYKSLILCKERLLFMLRSRSRLSGWYYSARPFVRGLIPG